MKANSRAAHFMLIGSLPRGMNSEAQLAARKSGQAARLPAGSLTNQLNGPGIDRVHYWPARVSLVLSGGQALGAVDLEKGESVYFDSRRERITPQHLLASTAFIPSFPPVEIDGRLLGDPGLISNLPLDPVRQSEEAADQLC